MDWRCGVWRRIQLEVSVQSFRAVAPELAVEILDVGVLGGLARLNQDVLNASRLHPRHEGSACELWAVVSSDGFWVAPEPCGLIQDAGDVCARHGQVHSNVNVFMGEVVSDGQALDASAIGQRIAGKVQAPGLIDAGGRHQWRAFNAVLLALVAVANNQALRTVKPEHLLVVGAGEFATHHVVHAVISKAPALHRDGMDSFTQAQGVCIGLRRMAPGIARQPHETAGPALGDLGVFQHLAMALRLSCGARALPRSRP